MTENLYVTVRVTTIIHEGENYYYGKDKADIDNSFTLPLKVYTAVNYSDVVKAMVESTIHKYENPKEDDDE